MSQRTGRKKTKEEKCVYLYFVRKTMSERSSTTPTGAADEWMTYRTNKWLSLRLLRHWTYFKTFDNYQRHYFRRIVCARTETLNDDFRDGLCDSVTVERLKYFLKENNNNRLGPFVAIATAQVEMPFIEHFLFSVQRRHSTEASSATRNISLLPASSVKF